MPERRKAVTHMVETRLGTQVWNGGTGRCQTMKTSEFVEAQIEADKTFVALANIVDWNRVLLIAHGRHLELKHDDADLRHRMPVEGVCGECIREALLQLDDFSSSWKADAPQDRPDLLEDLAYWKEDEAENGWIEYQDFPKIRKDMEKKK